MGDQVQNVLKGCVEGAVDAIVEGIGDRIGKVAVFASIVNEDGSGSTSHYCPGTADEDAVSDITNTLLHLSTVVSGTIQDLASSYVQDSDGQTIERTKREFIYAVCAGALGIVSEQDVSSDDGKKELMEYLNRDMNGEVAGD